jgi:hypothetical protein
MTFDQYIEAARFLRKYAAAVESDLYMRMKVDETHNEISNAKRLADILEKTAATLDTISPVDLG